MEIFSVEKSTLNVSDLLPKIFCNLTSSLTFDAIILGVGNLITLLRVTGSNPLSIKDVPFPPALVPEIVLILVVATVPSVLY